MNVDKRLRDEDVHLCQEEIPDGLEAFIRREVLPEDRVLIYKKGNVRGRCFICKNEVRAVAPQRFRSNEMTTCPICGTRVAAFLETSDRFAVNYVQNIATIQVGTDGKTVFLRQWHLNRDHSCRWENIPGQLEEIARYAIRGNKAAKWQHEGKSNYFRNCYRYRTNEWERVKDLSRVYDGSYEFFLPEDWKQQLAGTSLQYIDLQGYLQIPDREYRGRNIIRFCMDWGRYPAVEKLWKAGYRRLIHQRVYGLDNKYRNTIRWRASTIPEAVGFPLRFLKNRVPEEWNILQLANTQILAQGFAAGYISEAEFVQLSVKETDVRDIRLAMGHASITKIQGYLDKVFQKEKEKCQKEAEKAQATGRAYYRKPCMAEVTGTYRDYLKECVELGLNLDDRAVLFPKNLDAAHARTTANIKYKEDEAKAAKFEKRRVKLERMCYRKDGLQIRPAASAKELIAEGAYLHHCVGGYADRMADGVLAIMVIRKESDPDTPYFTLEWRDKRVIQCRTSRNDDYTNHPEVLAFVNEWTEWVLNGCKKRKNKKAA